MLHKKTSLRFRGTHACVSSAPPAPFRGAGRAAVTWGLSAIGIALALTACGRTTIVDSPYGTECSTAAACGEARACIAEFPGGYCSELCATAPCDPGGLCDATLGVCLATCTAESDCRAEYMCWRGACRPDCSTAADCGGGGASCVDGSCVGAECTTTAECGAGRVCIGSRCIAPPDAGPPVDGGGTLGLLEACTSSTECISGFCLPADRGGFCTLPCGDFAACVGGFPGATMTCGGATIDGSTGTFCVREQAGTPRGAPCSADAECVSRTCVAGLCSEGCDDPSDCDLGWTCGPAAWGPGSISACAWPPVAGVTITELPLFTTDVTAGRLTTEVRFVAPADSVSTTLRAEHVSGDSLPMTFFEVLGPRDLSLYSLDELSMLMDQHVRWIPANDYDAIGMLIPNGSPGRAVDGGSYTYGGGMFRFSIAVYERMAGDTGRMGTRVTALVKRAPGGVVTSGVIDLAIHMVGVGVTAAAAPSDTRVQALVTRLSTILSGAGITLGTPTYHDVSAASLSVIDSTDGTTSELAQLFRMSASRTGNVVSIFLVRGFTSSGGGVLLGVAGGIPGPPGIHGSMSSGVAVSFDASDGVAGGRFSGHIAAHELSHFLGLFHTTEEARPCGTGEMPPGCAPFGATDTITDTTRGDTSNLMNWSIVGSGTNTTITPGQAYVLLRNPMVR